jgi:hypothetical protein
MLFPIMLILWNERGDQSSGGEELLWVALYGTDSHETGGLPISYESVSALSILFFWPMSMTSGPRPEAYL